MPASPATSGTSQQTRKRKANEMENVDVTTHDTAEYATPARFLQTGEFSDITVYAGKEEKEYKLHKSVLALNSGYFQTLLRSEGFKENKENVINLPEQDALVFKYVLNWLYDQTLEPDAGTIFDLDFMGDMYSAAMYLDMGSWKEMIVGTAAYLLRSRTWKSWRDSRSQSASEDRASLVDGFVKFFNIYHLEADTLEPLMEAICEEDYVGFILKNEVLEEALLENPGVILKLFKLDRSGLYVPRSR